MEYILLILIALVTIVIFNFLKIFVLDKLNVNKWFILILGFALIMLSSYLSTKVSRPLALVFISLSVLPFLWFFNIINNKKDENKKHIKIKPKAKPNRIKSNK